MKHKIGADDAKNRLPELLRQVQAGKRFTITNRGTPVAELGPPVSSQKPGAKAAIEAFQAFREANPIGRKVNTRELIEDGRE